MNAPIMQSGEQITLRGRCADLRLFIIFRPFTVAGGGGYRWAALGGKTRIGSFSTVLDSPAAFQAMQARVRELHPKAALHIY